MDIVRVYWPIIASINPIPVSIDSGTNVNFSSRTVDPNSGSIHSYNWDFGDGTTASGASANHVFYNNSQSPVVIPINFVATTAYGDASGNPFACFGDWSQPHDASTLPAPEVGFAVGTATTYLTVNPAGMQPLGVSITGPSNNSYVGNGQTLNFVPTVSGISSSDVISYQWSFSVVNGSLVDGTFDQQVGQAIVAVPGAPAKSKAVPVTVNATVTVNSSGRSATGSYSCKVLMYGISIQ